MLVVSTQEMEEEEDVEENRVENLKEKVQRKREEDVEEKVQRKKREDAVENNYILI
tara:strand:- start:339 stop:506 length:168 start_codon:yes stop_codon:yes gene_type:complete